MHLSPREIEKLLLHNAGFVAQKRLARGLRLNYPESVALIAAVVMELVRDGKSVSELMDLGKRLLGRRQTLPGVAEMIHEVQVEATFPDGSKLVTVHEPVCREHGELAMALYGSFLPVPSTAAFPDADSEPAPGECVAQPGHVELNAGRRTATLDVTNTGDRPVQVGSHYHFIETNAALRFDRAAAYGMRLDIPAGTAVRFEPGETRPVQLVEIAGEKVIHGGNNLASGPVNEQGKAAAMKRVKELGFGNAGE